MFLAGLTCKFSNLGSGLARSVRSHERYSAPFPSFPTGRCSHKTPHGKSAQSQHPRIYHLPKQMQRRVALRMGRAVLELAFDS
eukprot:131827-Amphidinium_carterae.2